MIHSSLFPRKHAVRRSTMLMLRRGCLLMWLLLGFDDVVGMMLMRVVVREVMIERVVFVFALDEYSIVVLLANHDPRGQIVAQQKILENFAQLR